MIIKTILEAQKNIFDRVNGALNKVLNFAECYQIADGAGKIRYKVKNKQIWKLYIVQTQKEENYLEKYVLEYEDEENEILGILLSMAIDRISYENENLYKK